MIDIDSTVISRVLSGKKPPKTGIMVTAAALAITFAAPAGRAQTPPAVDVARVVASVVRPVMKQYGIPGMAVALTVDGRHYVADFGVASKASNTRVAPDTLFEIGSLTKTFTATLAAYAQRTGRLALMDSVSAEFPALRGSSFDDVRLVDLGTHTAGGLPLQFPDSVRTDADAMTYYRTWKPSHPPATIRLYSNPSIMLLGLVTAQRLHTDFAAAMQRIVLTPLGLRSTFLTIPPAAQARYAQGYTESGSPHRVTLGPLAAEAYGMRTTASDLLRFIDANLGRVTTGSVLRQAIRDTRTGYFRVGGMTQDLIWEQFALPASLPNVLRGNSGRIIFAENRAAAIQPPSLPRSDVLIDKTGSTSGFAAYAAFIPSRKIGIVLLANRAYPIDARVTAAYRVLSRLDASDLRP